MNSVQVCREGWLEDGHGTSPKVPRSRLRRTTPGFRIFRCFLRIFPLKTHNT